MKILVGIMLLVLASAPALAADAKQVKQAIGDAKAAFDKAVAEQGGWTSTQDLLKDAEASAAKGDNKTALELANKAKREADLSYAQATNEKKGWSEPDYLK